MYMCIGGVPETPDIHWAEEDRYYAIWAGLKDLENHRALLQSSMLHNGWEGALEAPKSSLWATVDANSMVEAKRLDPALGHISI